MTATHNVHSITHGPRLHLAFELSWNQWKLAFTVGHGQPARLRTLAARDLPGLLQEIHKAKRRFGTTLPGVYAALMIAGSWTIPLITSYVPHDAKASDVLHQTRVFRGVLARIVAFDHLYHLEHHLYPAVPHQNWVRLAQRLDPWFDAAGIKPVRIGF
jgi:beta-carotene hydroxylase